WSVPNTRCPVSAVSMAMAMVSRSRISPTSTICGSSRSADRSARLKLSVCLPTCRCAMTRCLFSSTYSIASSRWTSWSGRVRLAGEPGDLVGEIGVARLRPFPAVPLRHYGEEHQLELLGGQRRRPLPLHLAVGPEHRGLAHPQVQVGRRGLHQRLEQLAQRA